MNGLRIGDKVICIDDSEHEHLEIKLKLNQIYKIKKLIEFLGEIELFNIDAYWKPNRFKKVINFKQKIKFIKDLL